VSEHPSFPGGTFPLIDELPTDKAELRIYLIDPRGLRMPMRWVSGQGRTAPYSEGDTTWNRWVGEN
jgi:hypothetical protein